MIGSLELFAFMAIGCLCFVASTLNERFQANKHKRDGYRKGDAGE